MPFHFRSSMYAIAAVCLAAAAMLLSPAKAEATCGSYVMIGGAHVEHKEPPHNSSTPICHGPGCSRLPATPIAPLSIPGNLLNDSQELSALVNSDSPISNRSGWSVIATSLTLPAALGNSIFHPPRSL